MVWRRPGSVDHLHAVLSGAAACRYAYAHGLATNWTLRRQARVHVALLIASSVAVLWLSIAPSPEWKPAGDQSPVGRILGLLLVSIGAPFLLLSATAPLLQSWFSRTRPERFPYRLYALSNLGSLLAILSHPFLIEPAISLHRQASIWSWTYVVFALACGLVAWKVMSAGPKSLPPDERSNRGHDREARCGHPVPVAWSLRLQFSHAPGHDEHDEPGPGGGGAAPLILPLALYLLSFVIAFSTNASIGGRSSSWDWWPRLDG